MSQRAKTKRKRDSSQPEAVSSQQSQRKSTQNGETSEETTNDVSEMVDKCVRFFISRMHTNVPIKRADIVSNVFEGKAGRVFDTVLQKAKKDMEEIYGLTIEILDDTSQKKYVVANNLKNPSMIERTESEDRQSVILFLVLTHVFMSNDNASDTSLWKFLNEFDITPRTECSLVGNVKNYVTTTLVKQNYIVMENRGGQNEDGEPRKSFKWGARAEEVVSKMDILNFVAKIYGTGAKNWIDQFKAASEQFPETEDSIVID